VSVSIAGREGERQDTHEFRELALEEHTAVALRIAFGAEAQGAVPGGTHEAEEGGVGGRVDLGTLAPRCAVHSQGV
jgi:hypothetical protein